MPKIEKNKITFIIPSVNRDTLTNSINSLLNQTNKNWKCIIIYDGVDGIKFKDKRIKTIKKLMSFSFLYFLIKKMKKLLNFYNKIENKQIKTLT